MKYFLDPFGCVKNQVDAENMMAQLNKAGWENVSNVEQADLIIVNSCGFIESAKQESINAVIGWRKLYPDKKIHLTGCLSQRYAKELPELLTEADAFIGVENLPPSTGERPLLSLPGSAYVKISEGCDNRCSYCAIPLIRGGLVSRAIPDVVEECRALLNRGIVELNIIGQDIGAYGTDLGVADVSEELSQRRRGAENVKEEFKKVSRLPELLNAISKLEGDFWVRLLYIHPDHFPLEILDIIKRDKRFLPYFDIPFQHASTKILTAMNRNNTSASSLYANAFQGNALFPHENLPQRYLELLETIRARLPQAVIRSTFLLGFPGETEEDFEALLDFQQKAKLDWLGCFAYSREEGTAAYSMKKRVPSRTAFLRKQKIEERQIQITEKNMDRFTNLALDVLIEEQFAAEDASYEDPGANSAGAENLWLGRLYCHAPEIDGAAVIVSGEKNEKNLKVGTFAKCKVIARRGFDLEVRV